MKLVLLLFFIVMNANALESKVPGEYILTTKGKISIHDLDKIGNETPVVREMGNNRYLLKFKHDPGLETLQKNVQKDWIIQPNLKYKIMRKPKAPFAK
jgi:hypothetical protein